MSAEVRFLLYDPGPGDGTEVCCGHHEGNHGWDGGVKPICWQCGVKWYEDDRANALRFIARIPIVGAIWLWRHPIPHYEYHDFERAAQGGTEEVSQ